MHQYQYQAILIADVQSGVCWLATILDTSGGGERVGTALHPADQSRVRVKDGLSDSGGYGMN